MTIPAQFDAKTIDKWYDYWMKKLFHLSQTIEHHIPLYSSPKCYWSFAHGAYVKQYDSRWIRRARLKGFNACWVPGTDHASIATEAKL
jgi:valyl-tRNA synthetase